MKVLVTGALGHIGSKLIRELPRFFDHPEIRMIDNLSTQRYPSLMNLPDTADYRFFEADVNDCDLSRFVKGIDGVIHLAAITDAAGSFEIREKVEYVNLNATKTVAEACAEAGIPMIHLSSTSVYGTQKATVDEDCPDEDLKPQSPYAETKLREERLLQKMGAKANLRFISFRFGTIVGISPGMRFHTAVNKFCWQAVLGQPLTVWRTALHQKRPYLALDDAIAAIAFILDRRGFDGQVCNVLTENLTVNDIISMITPHIGEVSVNYVDAKIMNQLSYEVSSRRFRDRGFAITGSIKGNIADTIDVLRNAGGGHDC